LGQVLDLRYHNLLKTSIFIVPRSSKDWRGNEAGWITASGWAAAGQQLWGEAIVATTDGIYSPQESMVFPRIQNLTPRKRNRSIRRFIPEICITAYKDWTLKHSKPRIWPIEKTDELINKKIMLVWQRHDLFPGPGRRLADRFGVPLVISVEAAIVWEARRWGVKRPLWGKLLEKYSEARSLKRADLVSCVTDEVREKVIKMGVPESKVIVSPNRVDSSIFHTDVDGREISEKYDLKNKKVLGWIGSFRKFHGLDAVVRAFKQVNNRHSDTVLMLVGDGLEYKTIKKLSKELGIEGKILMPGKQPFTSIPSFLVNFDICIVSANSKEGFHYSPLKLREYLAMGKPVIAPYAGNLPVLFKEDVDMVFYDPDNQEDLERKMNFLLEDIDLKKSISENARKHFETEGTWVFELKKVCRMLHLPFD